MTAQIDMFGAATPVEAPAKAGAVRASGPPPGTRNVGKWYAEKWARELAEQDAASRFTYTRLPENRGWNNQKVIADAVEVLSITRYTTTPAAAAAATVAAVAAVPKIKRKERKAQEITRDRLKATLLLDHIELATSLIRAHFAKMTDEQFASWADGNHYGNDFDDPFRNFRLKDVACTDARRTLDGMYGHALHLVVDGTYLPPPDGARVYDCPNHGCPGTNGSLMTLEEIKEHFVVCVPACHAAGIANSDPWGRFDYVEGAEAFERSGKRWERSAYGLALQIDEHLQCDLRTEGTVVAIRRAQPVDDDRADVETVEDVFADEDHHQCPGCGYYQGVGHAGDKHASADAPAYPCDGSYYRASVAAEREAIIAHYSIGNACTGFASYAKSGDYVVTKALVAVDRPSWWKGRAFEADWDRLRSEGWSHDRAALPRMLTDEEYEKPEEWVYFEFRVAEQIAPSLFGGA